MRTMLLVSTMRRFSFFVAMLSAVASAHGGGWATSQPPTRDPGKEKQAVIYIEGVFDNSYPVDVMLAHARDVGGSGFTTVILAFLHVHADPLTFVYNNIEFSQATTLPEVIKILRASNSSVRNILLSIGGGGNGEDFVNMAAEWPKANATLCKLIEEYGLDGIDIDYEGGSIQTPRQITIDALMNKLVRLGYQRGWIVTSSSTVSPEYWIRMMNSTVDPKTHLPTMAWVNMQTYSPGGYDLKAYEDTVNAFHRAFPLMDNRVMVGSMVGQGSTWQDEQAKVTTYVDAVSTVPGAFIWDYRLMACIPGEEANGTAAQFASAILTALSGRPVPVVLPRLRGGSLE